MPSKKSASRKAAVREVTLRKYLGRALRDHRRQHALTISQVAELARISPGMLSKIENGQVAPTLDVIERTSTALGLTLGQLFQKYAVPDGSAQQVKAGQGMEVVRVGTKRGHTYHLLAYGRGPVLRFNMKGPNSSTCCRGRLPIGTVAIRTGWNQAMH